MGGGGSLVCEVPLSLRCLSKQWRKKAHTICYNPTVSKSTGVHKRWDMMLKGMKVSFLSSSLFSFCPVLSRSCTAPYEGGVWKVRVDLPDKYPFKSPSIGRSTSCTCVQDYQLTFSGFTSLTALISAFPFFRIHE